MSKTMGNGKTPPAEDSTQALATGLQRDAAYLGKRLSPICYLPAEYQRAVVEAGEVLERGAGAAIFDDPSDGEAVYYLLRGALAVTVGAGEVRVVEASEQDLVEAFYRPGQEYVAARARRDCVLFRVPAAVLLRQISLANSATPVSLLDVSDLADCDSGDGLELALSAGILARLPPDNIHRILLKATEVAVRAGDIILGQGDPGLCCFIVKAGVAEVHRQPDDGTLYRVAFKGPGDVFGEDALLCRTPRSATVRMRTDGVLLRIDEPEFQTLIRDSLVKPVPLPEAEALVAAGAQWLDMREAPQFARSAFAGAINVPESILRLRCTSLDSERQYVVCSDRPERSALGCFLLAVAGLDAWHLAEPMSLALEDDDGSLSDSPALDDDGEPRADALTGDATATDAAASQAVERRRYRRLLRAATARIKRSAEQRLRAAVQEVEICYLTELENKHRQVLELKRKVALQNIQLRTLRKAAARGAGARALTAADSGGADDKS